jgi:acetoacetate decarboxylase
LSAQPFHISLDKKENVCEIKDTIFHRREMRMSFFQDSVFTGPDRSPLFKPMPRFYKGFRKLSIFCEATKEGIRKALPAEFDLVSDTIEVFVMSCPEVDDVANPEMGPRNYLEGGVVVPARYKNLVGGHVLYEYVTTDDAMAGGREVWGYPKKMAAVSFVEHPGGTIDATVTRLGRRLINARFTPQEITFDKPNLHPRLQIKRIPRADGAGYDVDQIIRNDLKDSKVFTQVRGTASLALGGTSIMDPLFELGVKRVLGAEFIVAEFFLDYGSIFEDRLAAAR